MKIYGYSQKQKTQKQTSVWPVVPFSETSLQFHTAFPNLVSESKKIVDSTDTDGETL